MKGQEYWSQETNPATGLKFEGWRKGLMGSHDGRCDIDALLATEYGEMMAELAHLRFSFEEDTMGEACLEYYRGLGVKKELFSDGDFYSRWFLFTPLEMYEDAGQGKKYPLIFWNHGGANAIETDEFSTHFTQMVGKEKFMVCMPQNTCWDSVEKILDIIEASYPVDTERVYVTGYSQGGQAAHSALIRMPRRLAGAAPCGAEAFQLWDHLDKRYTLEEIERLRAVFVPVVQISGVYEFLSYLPHNHYAPIVMNKPLPGAMHTTYHIQGHDLAIDPTNPPGKRADKPYPPEGGDADKWKLDRLQLRLYTQGCKALDEDRCLDYHNHPEDRFHYVMGFYGDREETRSIGGVDHYIADVDNAEGICAYRYIGVDNFPHWPPLMMAEHCWEFLRNYRRDSKTGKVVCDPYMP